jgi:DNA polymerase III subunit delta
MKLDTRSIPGFLRSPDPGVRAVLLYGPDEGKVRERGADLARRIVPDLSDPFRVAELTGDAVADDPARLADEAAAIAMTGGRRVVRVRPAGNDCADAFAQFFKHAPGDALIVAEAGDLDGRSALRKVFEAAQLGVAVPCYADEGRDLARVIADILAQLKITAAREAVDWLATRLGGDSAVVKGELEKLALYVGSGGTASLDDMRAAIGDSAELDLDDVTRATATGDVASLARTLDRLGEEGTSAVTILRALQRHFARLHLAAGLIAAGRDEATALRSLRPPVFWKEEAAFKTALKRWRLPALARAQRRLIEAEIAAKTAPAGTLIVERCLLDLAAEAGGGTAR